MLLNNLLKEDKLKLSNSLFVYEKKDISIKILLFSILLILISNTFVESSFLFVENIKNIIYILVFISCAIYLSVEKIRKENIVLISIIFVLIYTFLYIESFFTQIELELYIKPILILPFFFYTFYNDKYKKEIFTILLIFLVFTFIYSQMQGFFRGNRLSSSSIDPNTSGLYILFAFYLARKINSKILMFIFLILGILTLSRNFILAIVCLYIFNYLKQIKSILKFLKINFVILLILLNIFLVSFSFFVKYLEFSQETTWNNNRLFVVFDESNDIRFKINRDVIENLFTSNENFLFGLGSDYPANEKYDINYKAHSGLLDFLTMYGFIYTSLYLTLLYYIIKNTVTYENIEYVYSYSIFSLFLPGAFGGIYLIILLFILNFQKK